MPLYRIDHKIWTVAELDQPQTIEGFRVRAIDAGSEAGAPGWQRTWSMRLILFQRLISRGLASCEPLTLSAS
jgi:hypothetical protein